MKGVLLLAHGSRDAETRKTLEEIAEMTRKKLPGSVMQTAFMQFSDMDIEKGLAALMKQGADDIKVVPYFLFAGSHIKEDIPLEIDAFRQKNPSITITLGETLGSDERLADIVVDRIMK